MEPIEAYQFHVNLRLPKTYIIYTEEATRLLFGEIRQGIDEAVTGLVEGSYVLRQTGGTDEVVRKSTLFIEMMEGIVSDSNFPYMGSPDCQQLLSFVYKYCMYQNAMMGSGPTNPVPFIIMAKPVAYDLVYSYACHLFMQSPYRAQVFKPAIDQSTGLPFVTPDAPFGLAFDGQRNAFVPILARNKMEEKMLGDAITNLMDIAIKAKYIQDQRIILQAQFSKRDGLLDVSVVKDYFVERKNIALHGAIDLDAIIAGESRVVKIPTNRSTGVLQNMELEQLEKLEKHSDPFIAKQREELLSSQQREMDRQARAIAMQQQIRASMSIDGTPLGFTTPRPPPPVLYVPGSMTPNEERYIPAAETLIDMRTGVESPADKLPDEDEGEIYNAVGNGEKPFILANGPDSLYGVTLDIPEELATQFQSFVGDAVYDLTYTVPLNKGTTTEKTAMNDMKACRLPSQNGMFGNFQQVSLGQQQIIKGIAGVHFPIPKRTGRVMLPPGSCFSINTQATTVLGSTIMPGAVDQSIIIEHDGEVCHTINGQPVQTKGVEDCSRVLVLRDYFNNPIFNQNGYPIMYRDMSANGQAAVELICVTDVERQYAQQGRAVEYLKTALQQVDQLLLATHLQAGGQTVLPALAMQAGFQMPMAAKNIADYRVVLLGSIQPNGAAVDHSVMNMNAVTAQAVAVSHEDDYLLQLTNRARNANAKHSQEAAMASQQALTREQQAIVDTALGFIPQVAATAQSNAVPMERAEIISIPQAAIAAANLPVEPVAVAVQEEVAVTAPTNTVIDGSFSFTLENYFLVSINDEVLPACWADEAPMRAIEPRSFNGQLNFASEEFRIAIAFIDGMATEFLVNVEAFELMDRSKHNPIYALSLDRGEYPAHNAVELVEPAKTTVPTIKIDTSHEIMQPTSRESLIAEGLVRANNGLSNPTIFSAEYDFVLPVGPIPQEVLANAWEAVKESNPGVRYFNYVLTVGTTLKEAGYDTVANYIDSILCNWWNIVLTQRLSAVGEPDDVWMSDFCNPETVTDLLAYLKQEGLTQEAMALFAKEVPALLNMVNSSPEGVSERFARLTQAQAEEAEAARIELLKDDNGDIDESYGEGPYSEEMKYWVGNRYCSLLNHQADAKVLIADAAEEVFTLGRLTYSLNSDFFGIVNSAFDKLPDTHILEVITGLGQHLHIARDEAKPFNLYYIVAATKVGK